MNSFFVTGRVGADPELKYTPNGTAILEVSVADSQKKGEGYITNWWKINLWSFTAELWAGKLKKGQEVAAYGTLSKREYTDKENRKRTTDALDNVSWFRATWKPEQEAAQQSEGPSL